MSNALLIDAFLKAPGAIFDVRSEGEFAQGHIQGAFNLPLFNNHERAIVGTLYKREGFTPAFLSGLKITGPKFASMLQQALHTKGPCKVLCWRGGMRSQSVAWLFKSAGLETVTLKGGYKAFRKWVLSTFERPFKLRVLGGLTGSGKTDYLKNLKQSGVQVIDLEALANHRGSAFGCLSMPTQPTVEHFENSLALQLASLDPSEEILGGR